MYPVSDEQRVEARARSAHDVRFHAVADSDDPILAERRAASPFGKRQRPVINPRVRLAGVDDRSAELFISTRQRSGAVYEVLAAMDDDVRIGANDCHIATRDRAQFRFVVVEHFGFVVSQSRA